jgi:SAM-dependent methyltransferase
VEDNYAYWDRRWSETDQDPDGFENTDIYPVKYADMVMTDQSARSLELGAGLGRVLKHYYYRGFNIEGIERSSVAVDRLKHENPALPIRAGDALNMPYMDEEFDVIMAFGVFHNIEHHMEKAIAETARCLKRGGKFAISMRPDNLEMRLNEIYWTIKNRSWRKEKRFFHKWIVEEDEFKTLLGGFELITDRIFRARNLSILYRLPMLRENIQSETGRRAAGYRLNAVGRILDRLLTSVAQAQFCNVLVYIGHRRL